MIRELVEIYDITKLLSEMLNAETARNNGKKAVQACETDKIGLYGRNI